MSYKLNELESCAIKWYKERHTLEVNLGLLPLIYFKSARGATMVHINILVEMYRLNNCNE
jgi:hypothetical protein